MNNAVLIQQAWYGDNGAGDYMPLMELTMERNADYCNKFGFDFIAMKGTEGLKYGDVTKGCWTKIELIQQALENGYEYIVWLDPDAIIYDLDTDLRLGCVDGIGVCWHRIPQQNHWNVGVMYVKNSQAVKNFIADWLASYPGERAWMEQGEFNELALLGTVVQTISDRWNATLNYSMVPDAVVIGFHGYGNAQNRLDAMKSTLESAKRTR